MALPEYRWVSVEEYLAIDNASDVRFEYVCGLFLSWNRISVKGQKGPSSSWNDSTVNIEKVREKRVSVEKVRSIPRHLSGTACWLEMQLVVFLIMKIELFVALSV
jgi:hypothetical protein